jgi:hypothetical protein
MCAMMGYGADMSRTYHRLKIYECRSKVHTLMVEVRTFIYSCYHLNSRKRGQGNESDRIRWEGDGESERRGLKVYDGEAKTKRNMSLSYCTTSKFMLLIFSAIFTH